MPTQHFTRARIVRAISVLASATALIFGLVIYTQLSAEPSQAQEGGVVNIYSARHYGAIEEPFTRFTEETGIEVRLSQGSVQSLMERLRAEGAQTPADVVLFIDAGGLTVMADEGLLQPISSTVLAEAIPDLLKDPDGHFYGVSQRVRTIMYNPEFVSPDELSTYAALADPMWEDRLCMRPATHIYTIALVASMIANLGEAETEEIVSGWVANNPTYINSDTRQLQTVAAGGCDVAVANHYYLGRLKAEDPDFPVEVFWANQEEQGTHRNITGLGVTANARNYDNAVTLIEWFATEGQSPDSSGLPGSNYEYPANPEAEVNEVIAEFGEFTIDPIDIREYGYNQEAAIQLLERTGYGFEETQ